MSVSYTSFFSGSASVAGARSWELLGMRGGGLLDLLVERVDQVGRPAADADGDRGGPPDD